MEIPYARLKLKQYMELGRTPPEILIKHPEKTMKELLSEEEYISLYFEDMLGDIRRIEGAMILAKCESKDAGEFYDRTIKARLDRDRRILHIRHISTELDKDCKLPTKYKSLESTIDEEIWW